MTNTDLNKSECLVHILDDDLELLESLEFALSSEGWPVCLHHDPEDFLASNPEPKPGCLLLDIQMPKMNGLEIQQFLADHGDPFTIILMSNYGTLDTAIKAFRKGAFDFLKKPIRTEELFDVVERAVIKDRQRKQEILAASPLGLFSTLTERERQVAKDLAQSLPSPLIAEHLGISERTLERHRQNVFKKLRTNNTEELRKFLLRISKKY